jgi:hypothetical protein
MFFKKKKINSSCLSYRLEEECDRSSHHASANVDLHVYTQKLENECRDLRCQITIRDKEKFELHEIITDFEVQVSVLNIPFLLDKFL